MATKVEAARERLYQDDRHAWAREQAALLRSRRFGALDLEHLIEAVEAWADMQREAVLSHARVVIEHLLKLTHSPPGSRGTVGAPRFASTAPGSSWGSRRACAKP
jgi:hypothetical protein